MYILYLLYYIMGVTFRQQ